MESLHMLHSGLSRLFGEMPVNQMHHGRGCFVCLRSEILCQSELGSVHTELRKLQTLELEHRLGPSLLCQTARGIAGSEPALEQPQYNESKNYATKMWQSSAATDPRRTHPKPKTTFRHMGTVCQRTIPHTPLPRSSQKICCNSLHVAEMQRCRSGKPARPQFLA